MIIRGFVGGLPSFLSADLNVSTHRPMQRTWASPELVLCASPLSPAFLRQVSYFVIAVVEDASQTWALPEVLYRASPSSPACLRLVGPVADVVVADALAMLHMYFAVKMTCKCELQQNMPQQHAWLQMP